MDDQITPDDPLPAAPAGVAEEGDGNHGDGNGDNPEGLVDGVLADLPVPSRDHIFADNFGADFHSGI